MERGEVQKGPSLVLQQSTMLQPRRKGKRSLEEGILRRIQVRRLRGLKKTHREIRQELNVCKETIRLDLQIIGSETKEVETARASYAAVSKELKEQRLKHRSFRFLRRAIRTGQLEAAKGMIKDDPVLRDFLGR
jgi:hypothetical protein